VQTRETAELGACADCDLVYRRSPLSVGDSAYCPRCGARLYGQPRLSPSQMAAVVGGALITFVIAQAFPIVEMRLQGIGNHATVLGSVLTCWSDGRPLVAITVFATAVAFPLADLLTTFALLACAARIPDPKRRPAWFAPLLRLLLRVRPWGMVEVFMLGVLVALVKLSHMARILPGPALGGLAALTILLALTLSYDLRTLWDDRRQ